MDISDVHQYTIDEETIGDTSYETQTVIPEQHQDEKPAHQPEHQSP